MSMGEVNVLFIEDFREMSRQIRVGIRVSIPAEYALLREHGGNSRI